MHIMSWTAPKIQAMLLKVAPVKAAPNLRPMAAKMSGPHAPSPRTAGAASKSGYGGK